MSFGGPWGRIRLFCCWTDIINPFDQRLYCGINFGRRILAPRVELVLAFLGEERLDCAVVEAGRVRVDHALHTDVFVEPDAPRDLVLVVDFSGVLN